MRAWQLAEGEEAGRATVFVEESCPSSGTRTGSFERRRSWSGCCCYCCYPWKQGPVAVAAVVVGRVVDTP